MAPVLYNSDPFTYPGGGIAAGVPVRVLYGGTEVSAAIFHDSVGTRKPNPVRTDSDGVVEFYADPGDYILRANGVDTVVTLLDGPTGEAAYAYLMTVGGAGGPGVGIARIYNDTGHDQVVVSVRVSAVDVSGGGLAADINIDGASIFASPAGRPTLPVALGTGTTSVVLADPVLFPDDSYLSVDVDTGTFAHLVVQVFVR
jgi:hypothetical protein